MTGVQRVTVIAKMDNQGRLLIPVYIRQALGVNIEDPLEMTYDGKVLIIAPSTKQKEEKKEAKT